MQVPTPPIRKTSTVPDASVGAGFACAEVEATWGIYQRMIAAYREPDRKLGKESKELMEKLIDSLDVGVPAALTELVTLGRTLKKCWPTSTARHQQRTHRSDQRATRRSTLVGASVAVSRWATRSESA